ncbi:hypothetical protein [Pleionea sp. CnH1-48]|uniref:hypothetical protein n=1 Tax=Pleionea sp. CnH1-48 TaxID=2954494 RepID=UPI0020984CF8|nr:hypothetical protein [Pleionea sp. CnH1-48]MCO7225636.1 hypothetical protein [Pleionea sp. CnH1-48]
MRKLFAVLLLTPLMAFAAQKQEVQKSAPKQAPSKQHQKVVKHHERHWQQPHYDRHTTQYKCVDAWGHSIRGRFIERQKYFIELGGGWCRQVRNDHYNNGVNGDLSEIYDYSFPEEHVYDAIRETRRKFGIRNSRFIEAIDVDNGFKSFKYTLVFKVKHQGIREFRVKHNYWNGDIRYIREL